jgi:hypothetical protein
MEGQNEWFVKKVDENESQQSENTIDTSFGSQENNQESQEQNQDNQEQNQDNSQQENSENQETQNQQQEQEQQQSSESLKEVEYDDDKVLEIVKKKLGVEVSSFEDLKPKEQKKLTPDIEKFLQFQEETGNSNYSDFLATQKDWSQEDKSSVLRAYLKSQNPMLDDSEINFMFNKKYGVNEDFDDDDTALEKKITEKQDYHKALELLEQQKEKYKVPSGSEEFIPKQYKEAKEYVDKLQQQQQLSQQIRESFVQETQNLFVNNFEGFEVELDGKKFKIKPENIEATKSQQLDIGNFERKHFDEKTGKLIDAKQFHLGLFAANDPIKFAKHFFELGKAELAEQEEIRSKNLDMGKQQVPHNTSGKSEWVVKKVD